MQLIDVWISITAQGGSWSDEKDINYISALCFESVVTT